MWDNDGVDALFDQEGNFRDQEAFETFVEGYRPEWSFHPDEVDDFANTFNVDYEPIWDSSADTYLGENRYVFDCDFEAAASSVWHFGRLLVPHPVNATTDMYVRASPWDYFLRSGVVLGTNHPLTCGCPTCNVLWGHDGVTPRYVRPLPTEPPATDYPPASQQPTRRPLSSPGEATRPAATQRPVPDMTSEGERRPRTPDLTKANSGSKTPESGASATSDVEKRRGDMVPPLIRLPTMPPSSTSLRQSPAYNSPPATLAQPSEITSDPLSVPEAIPRLPAADPPLRVATPRRGWFARILPRWRRR